MKQIISFLMLFMPLFVGAQNTMYFMDRLPQNISFNPAFVPNVKFYLGLPGIGGVSANAYNSGFNYNELDEFIDNIDKSGYLPDKFIESIGDYNTFTSEINASIFSMGFKLKETGYLSFGLSMNSLLSVKADSKIAYLLADYDNISVADFPLEVSGINFLANNYLTLNLAYSRKLNDHLTVGISPAINFNLIGIKADKLSYIVEIEDSEFADKEYNQTISGEVLMGLPVEINPDAINGNEFDLDQGFLPDNWEDDLGISDLMKDKSLTLNIGATYSLEKWMFSGSILNIGSSSFKTNSYQLNGSNETILIKDVNKMKIGIPTKFYIGAKRQFNSKWNYGLVLNSTHYNWGSRTSGTISLNGFVGKMLSTSVSYTAGYKFNNIGLGLRMRFLPGADLFFVTDNLLQSFNYRQAYRLSASFGINVSVGVKPQVAL